MRPGLASPEMQAMMKKLGVSPRPGAPADFGAFLARESTKWQTVAKNAGIRIK
jgi:tripartite-type tricarboxylate transporter receptor subunit TctC